MKAFFLIFIVIPLIELYVLIEVGGVIGGLSTILLILLTAIIGGFLVRTQGIATVQKAQAELSHNHLPRERMLEGVLILFGGVLLLLPGFISDSIGLILLLPPVRHALVNKFVVQKQHQGFQVYEAEWHEKRGGQESIQHVRILEGEVVDSDKRD